MIHASNLMAETVTITGTVCQHSGRHLGCGRKVPVSATIFHMARSVYPNSLGVYMKMASINDPRLAELVESNKQQIFKLRHGERKLTVQWAMRIAPHLGVPWEALLQDPAQTSDPRRGEILANFDSADERGRDIIHTISRRLAAPEE